MRLKQPTMLVLLDRELPRFRARKKMFVMAESDVCYDLNSSLPLSLARHARSCPRSLRPGNRLLLSTFLSARSRSFTVVFGDLGWGVGSQIAMAALLSHLKPRGRKPFVDAFRCVCV